MRIGAVILAAGESRRMGASKPLLAIDGQPLFEKALGVFRGAGADPVVFVVRPDAAELCRGLARIGATWVVNPRPQDGMFSSTCAGVRALPADLDAFFVHPVDIPFVLVSTLRSLVAARRAEDSVVHPTFDGRRGHPPLIAASLIPLLLRHDGQDGLRGFLAGGEAKARCVPCEDAGILLDLDTPDDYREATRRISATRAGTRSRS